MPQEPSALSEILFFGMVLRGGGDEKTYTIENEEGQMEICHLTNCALVSDSISKKPIYVRITSPDTDEQFVIGALVPGHVYSFTTDLLLTPDTVFSHTGGRNDEVHLTGYRTVNSDPLFLDDEEDEDVEDEDDGDFIVDELAEEDDDDEEDSDDDAEEEQAMLIKQENKKPRAKLAPPNNNDMVAEPCNGLVAKYKKISQERVNAKQQLSLLKKQGVRVKQKVHEDRNEQEDDDDNDDEEEDEEDNDQEDEDMDEGMKGSPGRLSGSNDESGEDSDYNDEELQEDIEGLMEADDVDSDEQLASGEDGVAGEDIPVQQFASRLGSGASDFRAIVSQPAPQKQPGSLGNEKRKRKSGDMEGSASKKSREEKAPPYPPHPDGISMETKEYVEKLFTCLAAEGETLTLASLCAKVQRPKGSSKPGKLLKKYNAWFKVEEEKGVQKVSLL